MDKLQGIYYRLSHLWKGQTAVKKLREFSKEKRAVIKGAMSLKLKHRKSAGDLLTNWHLYWTYNKFS